MIRKYVSIALLSLGALMASTASKAAILDFEDITDFDGVAGQQSHRLSTEYGFKWTTGKYNQPLTTVRPEGSFWWQPYPTGPLAHSGNNFFSTSLIDGFKLEGHGIKLNSMWIRAAGMVSESALVGVLAFKDGIEIGSKEFRLTDEYQLQTFDFLEADTLYFGSGAYGAMILDDIDISYTSAVPEPESYGMLLAGLGLIGFAVRRKGRSA